MAVTKHVGPFRKLPGKKIMNLVVAVAAAASAFAGFPRGAPARPRHAHASLVDGSPTEAASAVVVGGGPSGLASACVLAKRGFQVTVLEQRAEPSPYEPQKAYLYLIDGRGQQFTDLCGLTDQLAAPDLSVSSTNYTVTRLMPDGERVEAVPPILETNNKPSYWIPRAGFLDLLLKGAPPNVKTVFGAQLVDITKTDDGAVEVVADCADGKQMTLRPSLLVGADGLNSLVRAKCATWSEKPADFTPVLLPSPSSGLRYQMLRLPPAFPLDASDASVKAEPRRAYSFRPSKTAPLGPTRLGLLPVADPNFPRTANVILPPEHKVWGLSSAAAVSDWLRETFPASPIDEIVSEDEAAAFATATPGAFPAPCYSPKQHLLLPKAAICLVGDAIHAFPPDIGQGVNAALADVMHLHRALQATPDGDGATDDAREMLGRALPAYSETSGPEAEAVARIAQIGFPYQYPITREANPLQRIGWFANFFLRTFVLAKLAPKLFSPAAIVLVQRSHLSYQQVWRMAGETTRRLQGIAAVGLIAAAWPWLRRLALV